MYRDISVLTDRVKDIEGHLERIAQALEGLAEVLSDHPIQVEFKPGSELERAADYLQTIATVLDEDNLNVRALLLPDQAPIKVMSVPDTTIIETKTRRI